MTIEAGSHHLSPFTKSGRSLSSEIPIEQRMVSYSCDFPLSSNGVTSPATTRFIRFYNCADY
ncbi:hypothetical protein [Chitinophaga sp. 22308]|uniref:hypothetical protein n=1 Tax=unclassified Chitinophaga TaxID=2619133 RepID=UPI003F870347